MITFIDRKGCSLLNISSNSGSPENINITIEPDEN